MFKWSPRPLLVVAAFGVMLAGCSSSPSSPQVATANSAPSAAQVSPSVGARTAQQPPVHKLSDYDKAQQYTRCLTKNGVPTPDPVEGERLVTYNTITVGETAETVQLKRQAHARCKQLLPARWPLKVDPGDLAKSRAYFDCLKKAGFDEAPTPGQDGMANYPTDPSTDFTKPGYPAAEKNCRRYYDDPANHQPDR